MTSLTHGRLGRFSSTRLRLVSLNSTATLSLALALLAGCATPPGGIASVSDSNPTSAGMTNADPAADPRIAGRAPPPETEPVPAPVPVDPLRPEVRLDLNDRTAQTDLWARVRAGFTMPDLDTDLVRNREQWYASRPDYVQRMTERGGRYLFHIVEELERRGMPTELALLPFIESAFNPQAVSSARASGMWQFMAATGKDFSLKQNVFRDDRRDVLQSTRAALDYLQRLYAMFGDWHLALAAYNWGEGSVQRAIAKNEKLGLPTDYGSLKMPSETQYYVPKLQAVKNIVAHPAEFGLSLPEIRNHPYFLSVPIERDMDVAVAIRLAGMPLEEFQYLNPQMNKPVILAAGTPQVLLPYDNANLFVRRLPQHRGPLASWTAWTVPKTMRPAEAAREVGMSEAQLREVNRIPLRMLVKSGSTLLVPRGDGRQADVSIDVADNATMALAPDVPPLRRMSLKAGRKDTVSSVAKRYRVSPTQVAQWNSTGAGAQFKPGQTIVVYVAHRTGQADPDEAVRGNGVSAQAASSKVLSGKARPGKTAQASPVPVKGASVKAVSVRAGSAKAAAGKSKARPLVAASAAAKPSGHPSSRSAAPAAARKAGERTTRNVNR